jgi:hypothetical protein
MNINEAYDYFFKIRSLITYKNNNDFVGYLKAVLEIPDYPLPSINSSLYYNNFQKIINGTKEDYVIFDNWGGGLALYMSNNKDSFLSMVNHTIKNQTHCVQLDGVVDFKRMFYFERAFQKTFEYDSIEYCVEEANKIEKEFSLSYQTIEDRKIVMFKTTRKTTLFE